MIVTALSVKKNAREIEKVEQNCCSIMIFFSFLFVVVEWRRKQSKDFNTPISIIGSFCGLDV